MNTTTTTAGIRSITLEVDDVAEAQSFYAALGLRDHLQLRPSAAVSSGFRGFTISLVASQPSAVDKVVSATVGAGGNVIKPVAKSFWGYGGVVGAPDGTIWKVATSQKKNVDPDGGRIHDLVILLGVSDMAATKDFYVHHGFTVARSFGRKYAEFDSGPGQIKLALYGRRGLARDAGVSVEGSGSHRLIIHSDAGPFTDPDGFVWTGADDE